MSKILFASLLLALVFQTILVDGGILKRSLGPKSDLSRQSRSTTKERLPYDSAELNLDAANDLMVDILKDVDLLLEELHLVESARKELQLQKSLHEEKFLELLSKV